MPLSGAVRTTLMYERVTAGFVDAGWPIDRALSAIICIESFVLGSALDAAAPGDMFALADDAPAPTFRTAYEARRERLGHLHPSDEAFERGLRALVRGLAAELAELRAAAEIAPSPR